MNINNFVNLILIIFLFLTAFQHAKANRSCESLFAETIDPVSLIKNSKMLDPKHLSILIELAPMSAYPYRGRIQFIHKNSEIFWAKIFETTAESGIGRIIINTWNDSFPLPAYKGIGIASLAYLLVADHFYRTEHLVLTSDEFYEGTRNDTLSMSAQKLWDGFRNRGYLKNITPSNRYGEFNPDVITGQNFENLREFALGHLRIIPHDRVVEENSIN